MYRLAAYIPLFFISRTAPTHLISYTFNDQKLQSTRQDRGPYICHKIEMVITANSLFRFS